MKLLRSGLALLALLGAAALVAWLAGLFDRPPAGAVPIAWDKETCVECRMHIGDPSFAAQLHTRTTRVLNFDDPGCLFRYLDRAQPDVAATYFHHLREDRWLPAAQAGFVRVPRSPMGYGLGAVDARRAEMTPSQARAMVADARDAGVGAAMTREVPP